MATPEPGQAGVRVSVIIPAYNAERTIARTLDSLLAQTHTEWDAIVVDDGSTDGTASIVEAFAARESRVRLIRQSNGGEAAARNTGIANATNDWLLFLDADDWVAPSYLERMGAALVADPALDAVHCGYVRVAADGGEVVEQYEPPAGDLFHVLARRAAFPVHACVVRAALVREVGLFDTSFRTSSDWDLWQRVARTGANFGAVREVLAFYRMSPAGASLDARQLFLDGMRVLKQGMSADPRVAGPHPAHVNGVADQSLESQEFYLLCWCAGLVIGTGRDARALLGLVGDDRFPGLWAPAVAQCLFESAPLPACQGPSHWERIWPVARHRLAAFLTALESRSGAPGLARDAETHLARMVVNLSPTLRVVQGELAALTAPLEELRTSLAHLTEASKGNLAALREQTLAEHQALAEEQQREAAEQREALEQVRSELASLQAEHNRWQDLAEECAAAIAGHLDQLTMLETRNAELERQIADERQGRVLAERQLQRREDEISVLNQTIREHDDAVPEKLEAIAGLQAELAQSAVRERHLDEELHRERGALERASLQRQHLEETIEWSREEIERSHRSVREAEGKLLSEASALNRRAAEFESRGREREQRHQQEIQELHASPEWRVGHLLWNRARLSRVGRPAARLMRRAQGRRTREALAAAPKPSRASAATAPVRRAVAAACWNFPIPSQTFVYQEVQALEWAGFDYRFFCCEAGSRDGLPDAFQDVWDRRVVLKTDWEINKADLEHFMSTRPERVDSLLERLGGATGLSRDELLQQSIVMTGFTFARHVELFGADYLHTYFFYDQSLMGLMAGWLLGIPRGITAYADHMLDDYPFKLVALQLELADIVVATSARIKAELGVVGGGRFDQKILVKPNGVNTERFPYVPAATRLGGEREPELISVSRIEPKKGLIHLVDAVALLEQRGVRVRVNIVGGVDRHTPSSAECHRELVARIEALGLKERVILHGPMQQSEFLPMMASGHALVAPYVEVSSGDKDGIPTAVLEAMSCGLPVVATDAGSITEAVAHNVEGLIVPQRNATALADAIATLVTDRARYVLMSDAARRRAITEFDARVTERRLHDRIAGLLDARTGQTIG